MKEGTFLIKVKKTGRVYRVDVETLTKLQQQKRVKEIILETKNRRKECITNLKQNLVLKEDIL